MHGPLNITKVYLSWKPVTTLQFTHCWWLLNLNWKKCFELTCHMEGAFLSVGLYCRECGIAVHYAVTTLLCCVWSRIENNSPYTYHKLCGCFFAAAVLVVLSRNVYWEMNFQSLFHCLYKRNIMFWVKHIRGNCHFYTKILNVTVILSVLFGILSRTVRPHSVAIIINRSCMKDAQTMCKVVVALLYTVMWKLWTACNYQQRS
jgi:hypothetical protein